MTISISDRFWSKVDKTENCWLWRGAKYRGGYGAFRIDSNIQTTAHRVAYILTYGELPKNLIVCHSCDNRLCVNPSHLFIGTQQDNIDDMFRKGRQAKKELLGHKQVGELNHAAKLTEAIVLEIRELFKLGFSQADIGRKTGVSRLNIWNIVHHKSWTHI